MSDEPRRLLDDPNSPALLRQDLEVVRAVPPPIIDPAFGLARLQDAIQAGAAETAGGGAASTASTASTATTGATSAITTGGSTASTATVATLATTASTATTGLTMWIAAGLATVAVVGGLGATLWSPSVEPPVTPQPAAITPEVEQQAKPTVEQLTPMPEQEASSERRRPKRKKRIRRRAKPTVEQTPVDPDARLRKETDHLARTRQALQSNPGKALRLAQSGSRQFRDGMFEQERQAIAVLALSRMGKEAQFKARAKRFLKRYPNSPSSERIRQLLKQESR